MVKGYSLQEDHVKRAVNLLSIVKGGGVPELATQGLDLAVGK